MGNNGNGGSHWRSQILNIDLADADAATGRDSEDDWTGITDAASRRKRQTRLNTRAYRRRKALESKTNSALVTAGTGLTKTEPAIPCWVEDQQTVTIFPASIAKTFHRTEAPLLPYYPTPPHLTKTTSQPIPRIIFPLSPDHLITLLQYDVLRACLINRQLLTPLFGNPTHSDCSSPALHTPPTPSFLTIIPPLFYPTHSQLTVPHEHWIDIIPHPRWRDNLILATGTFDGDELWSDTIGGLFKGFPASDIEYRGVAIWDPPWDVKGWEISERFYRKWGWSMVGCEDVLEATNRWKREKGEEDIEIVV